MNQISDEFRAVVKAITNDLYVASWDEQCTYIDVECQHNSKHSHTIRFSINDSDVTVKGIQIISLGFPGVGFGSHITYDEQISRGTEDLMDPWSIGKLKQQIEAACSAYTKMVDLAKRSNTR